MGFVTATRLPMALGMTLFSYIMFILSIVMVCKKKDIYGSAVDNYPASVVALLVCGCLQMCWMTVYWVKNKAALYSARNMLLATALFACWNFGAVVALTVKRHDYCPAGGNNVDNYSGGAQADCQGVIRGTMGMSWVCFIWDLLYIGAILGMVSSTRASSATPIGKIGQEVRVEETSKA